MGVPLVSGLDKGIWEKFGLAKWNKEFIMKSERLERPKKSRNMDNFNFQRCHLALPYPIVHWKCTQNTADCPVWNSRSVPSTDNLLSWQHSYNQAMIGQTEKQSLKKSMVYFQILKGGLLVTYSHPSFDKFIISFWQIHLQIVIIPHETCDKLTGKWWQTHILTNSHKDHDNSTYWKIHIKMMTTLHNDKII